MAKKKTSITLSEKILLDAKTAAEALERSVSWVLEKAIEVGLPTVVTKAEKQHIK